MGAKGKLKKHKIIKTKFSITQKTIILWPQSTHNDFSDFPFSLQKLPFRRNTWQPLHFNSTLLNTKSKTFHHLYWLFHHLYWLFHHLSLTGWAIVVASVSLTCKTPIRLAVLLVLSIPGAKAWIELSALRPCFSTVGTYQVFFPYSTCPFWVIPSSSPLRVNSRPEGGDRDLWELGTLRTCLDRQPRAS